MCKQAAACVNVSFLTVATYYGYGNDDLNLSKQYAFRNSKYFVLATLFSLLASGLAKASAACFLLVMQGRAHRRSEYLLYFIGGMSVRIPRAQPQFCG